MSLITRLFDRRREIVIELPELDAEKLGFAAIVRAAPTNRSRDWHEKSALRIQQALTLAQSKQTNAQIANELLPVALTEAEWKAVGRLCLMEGEKSNGKWARGIATRIMTSASARGEIK